MNQQTQFHQNQSEKDNPLVDLFRHNLWANLRLLNDCAALDDQQLAATTAGTYGSIYDTLKHFVASEQGYLNLLTFKKQGVPLGWEDKPTLAALHTYAQRSGRGLIGAAVATAPSDVVRIKWHDGQYRLVPSSHILTQAINHATEHRSQVMTILTQQGIEPPDLSGWFYTEEHISPS